MRLIPAVFVYEDGTVGLPHVPDWEIYREPVIQPFSIIDECADVPAITTVMVREYARRGKMFDGRPVFCAAGFDAKTACIYGTSTFDAVDELDRVQRSAVRRFVEREYPGCIHLDEWCGDWPVVDDEQAQLFARNLRKRGVRLLVAFRREGKR